MRSRITVTPVYGPPHALSSTITRPAFLSPASLPLLLLSLLPLLLLLLLLLPGRASADCECGYAAVVDGARHVFTDLIETDFGRMTGGGDVVARDTDWERQAFNLSAARARGPLGEMFAVGNVVADEGLRLGVGSRTVDEMVPVAEIDSSRMDLLWGTFRASMRLTGVPGTCAAFFWYFNDTQEIDMEFLSKDFNHSNGSFPVNLVLQSRDSLAAGYNARATGNFVQAQLGFDPTAAFHEYRIDFLPGRVSFHAGGRPLAHMVGAAVPDSPGHLILQHWSNGNALWSGGPPAEDAALVVQYVKAYFNSSAPQRQRDWAGRCGDAAAPGAVCDIPERTEGNTSAAGWFFSDGHNMTNNQTVYGKSEGSRSGVLLWWWLVLSVVLLFLE